MNLLNDKVVVVTGGAGFLGREVCRQVEACDPKSIFVPRSKAYDLRHREAIEQLMADSNPDIVIHLAAIVGGIEANRLNPGRFFYENAIMGVELIEQARRFDVEKFVSIGSICAYPKFTPVPFREDDIWNGYPEETNAPYGLAKKMLLVQSQAYRQQYNMNAITLFPVNLYGPGDNFDLQSSHVIPALIRKVCEAMQRGEKQIEVWGTGVASREFLYVADAAEGIVKATLDYEDAEPVNLGSGTEIRIRELAEMICEVCGYSGKIEWNRNKPDGQPRRCLDTNRAKDYFGFEAKTELRDGILETVNWYRQQRSSVAA
ncbi:MAG: GDP-L-fucose synthase [Planctomycetota bacterium]|nr:GDP-L-fucose synthase [Planctomycetota bacterium]MEC8337184.1 GDP-L-fucose synthase [Planctomycetota bacterium]